MSNTVLPTQPQIIEDPKTHHLQLLLEKLGAKFKVRQMVKDDHQSSEVLCPRFPALA